MNDSTDRRNAETMEMRRVSGDADTLVASAGPKVAGPFKRGDRIGRYVVLEERGKGGMGIVYAAYDPELDRRVALKLLRPRVMGGVRQTDPEARALLLHEAQSAAKLRHPNVTTVHDVGQTDGGSVFLAMEFVDGQDLRQWLAESPPWREVLDAFIAAGRGLEAAHAAGIIHRDFKPGNVMRDGSGQVMVTDFGLAQAMGPRAPELGGQPNENATTADGLSPVGEGAVGTPAYMPPEQYKGQPGDERSDVFAFCVSLYEGLYGELPFQGRSLVELLQQMRTGDVEVPKEREVPGWVRRAVLRGLASEPADRWPSMTPLLEALSQDPIARRYRVLTLGAVAIVLVAVGVNIGSADPEVDPWCETLHEAIDDTWGSEERDTLARAFASVRKSYSDDLWEGTRRRIDGYANSWEAAGAEICAARRETDDRRRLATQGCLDLLRTELSEVVVLLSQPDPEVLDDPIGLVEELNPLSSCTDSERPDEKMQVAGDPETERRWAEVGAALRRAHLLLFVERVEETEDALQQARSRLGEDVHPAFRMEIALIEASILRRRGEYLREYDRLIAAVRHALASGRERQIVRCMTRLIYSERRAHEDSDAARRWASLAEGVLERINGDLVSEMNVDNAVAVTYLKDWDYERARDLLLALNEVAEEEPSVSNHLREAIRNNLGAAYGGSGDYERSIELFEHQIELRRQRYGERHPRLKKPMWNVARAYYQLDELEAALEHAEEVRSIIEESWGPRSGAAIDTYGLIADIHAQRNDIGRSLAARQLAHEIAIESLPSSDYARFANDIELIYAYGYADLAEEALDVAEELVAEVPRSSDVSYAKALTARSDARRKMADFGGSLADAEEALAVYARSGATDGLPSAYYEHGLVLLQLGRHLEALEAIDASLAVSQPNPTAFTPLLLGHRAGALAGLGRIEDAVEALEGALEYVNMHGPAKHECWVRMELVDLLTASGVDPERAWREASSARAPSRAGGMNTCPERAQAWLEAHADELRPASERDTVRAP